MSDYIRAIRAIRGIILSSAGGPAYGGKFIYVESLKNQFSQPVKVMKVFFKRRTPGQIFTK